MRERIRRTRSTRALMLFEMILRLKEQQLEDTIAQLRALEPDVEQMRDSIKLQHEASQEGALAMPDVAKKLAELANVKYRPPPRPSPVRPRPSKTRREPGPSMPSRGRRSGLRKPGTEAPVPVARSYGLEPEPVARLRRRSRPSYGSPSKAHDAQGVRWDVAHLLTARPRGRHARGGLHGRPEGARAEL